MSLSKPAINVPTLMCEDDVPAWHEGIRLLCLASDCWDPVAHPNQEPEGATELKEWKRADRRALAFIQATIAPNLRQLTAEAKPAVQAYGCINAHYRDNSLTNQICLKKSIFLIRQDDQTPCIDLTAQILIYQNQLRLMENSLQELDFIIVLLASLNPWYSDWIEKIEKWREEELTWDKVTKSLFREEARQAHCLRDAEAHAAILARNAPLRPKKEMTTCSFCHKTGHTESHCFKKKQIEKARKLRKPQMPKDAAHLVVECDEGFESAGSQEY
jgi:hypothetical protein